MPTATAYFAQPKLLIDGQSNDLVAGDLVAVLVEETTAGLYYCELRLNNFGQRQQGIGFLYFGRDVLDFGKEIAVQSGPPGSLATIFQGRISAIEASYHPDGDVQMAVLAEDRLQDLRMTRRTRTFEDVSDEDVLRQIAGEHGLTPEMSLDGPTHPVLAQVNQSDLAFMRERARAIGAELWVEGTTLHCQSRSERDAGSVDLEYGVNLMAFTVRADLAHQCTELGVAGWDVDAKEAIDETADDSVVSSELNGGTSGASVLEEALLARQERLVHSAPRSVSEARSEVEARFRERARRFVTGSGVSDGDPRIRVGCSVNVAAVGSLFNGSYYVSGVRHLYDGNRGYRTEFDVERPGIGPAEA